MAVNILGCPAVGAVHPCSGPAQLKCASLVVRRFIQVMADNPRDDGLEVGTSTYGRLPLDVPRIGTSNHTNVAVTPRLLAYPLDGVVAIIELVNPWIENTIGVVAASHILGHVNIAVLGVKDAFIY